MSHGICASVYLNRACSGTHPSFYLARFDARLGRPILFWITTLSVLPTFRKNHQP